MKKVIPTILAAMVIFLFTGCQNADSAKTDTASDKAAASEPSAPAAESQDQIKAFLTGHKFILKNVNGQDFIGEKVPFFELAADLKVHGQVCNNFNGQAELADKILKFGPAAATKMICPQEGLDQLEYTFFKIMMEGVEVTIADQTLTLKGGEETLVYTAEAKN